MQKMNGNEDAVDTVAAAAAALEAMGIGGGLGGQSFPAGPWRSMQSVGLGVGEYTKVRTIAKGSQGMVVEVESRTGERFAMKEIPLPGLIWQRDFPKLLQGADREVRALKGLAWASGVVVKLVDCWISADFKQANIVMELLPHTLRDILDGRRRQNQGPPPVEQSARWFTQVTVGLAAIHSSGYIHRDVKPSNLLLTEDLRHCKIADLGVSRPLCSSAGKPHAPAPSTFSDATSDVMAVDNNFDACSGVGTDITEASRATGATGVTEATSIISGYTQRPGTTAYSSPEALHGKYYDIKLDVFSLGCVLLELLAMISVPSLKIGDASGKKLLETVEEALRKQEELSANDAMKSETCIQLQQIGLRMLDPSADLRPTPQEVMSCDILKTHLQAILQESPELSRTLQTDRGGSGNIGRQGSIGRFPGGSGGQNMRTAGLSLFGHGR
jgi:serine/threonine protein kinase